jgi:hypothetical protein
MKSADNDSSTANRAASLRALVELQIGLGAAITGLARFPWDCAEELVTLTRVDLIRMLNKYLSGELTADDWQRWAEALEGRDDVGFDSESSELLKEFIFQSATPEIFEALTPQLAARWLMRLDEDAKS